MKLEDIQIRDPFVLRDEDKWYLFGSTDKDIWYGDGLGFDVYISGEPAEQVPREFSGPVPAFRPPPGFWSSKNFWAPEVYRYYDEYYMFATFKANENAYHGRRGTAVLKASALPGPFEPWSDGPVTPAFWECLDGTLYIDPALNPWMVFCHEWKQIGNGEICALPLTKDLREAAGDPLVLFRGADAPWTRSLKGQPKGSYVTDGPFLYTETPGALTMLWSSFTDTGYAVGLAAASVGGALGLADTWLHITEPLYLGDGGHGMVFRTGDGVLHLAMHRPNKTPMERAVFIDLTEPIPGLLRIANPEEPF